MTAGTAALADKLPQSLAQKKIVIVCGSGNLDVVRSVAIRAQARNSSRYYGIAIKALNDITIKLRDMMEISAKDISGSGSFVEGRYAVYEYQLSYTLQKISTTMIGYRQESYVGPQQATGAPASQSMGTDLYKTGQGGLQPVTKQAVPLGS